MEIKLASQKWLENLLEEVAVVDPGMMAPSHPVGENEIVIGVVEDEFLKKMCSLAMYHQRERDRNKLEMAYAAGEERAFLGKAAILSHDKSEIFFKIFWSYVREASEIWDAQHLGVREGWQIVRIKVDHKGGILDFFLGGQAPE